MCVKILTDSACDMIPAEAEALGVTCIPIQISFGTETYEDAVTLPHNQFYEKLAASEALPVTSQVNPMTYGDYYAELTADGSEVVVIALSSGLSGTYQNAVLAAQDYPDRVFVVDSLNASSGQFVLVKRAKELAEQGLTAREIAEKLEMEKQEIRVVALIDTLEYLKKGGRISATVAFAGGVLGIKPAIEVKDGKIVLSGTARGMAKGHQLLKKLIESYGGIDWSRPVALIYSGSSEQLDKFVEKNPELWEGEVPKRSLGGTIGTHIGPGACGVAFFSK